MLAAADEGLLISDAQETFSNDSSNGRQARDLICSQPRPPVAFASVAPFPFLPAPLYVAPDS